MRRDYAAALVLKAGVSSPPIYEAFAAVPREAFLGAPPWQIGIPPTMTYVATDDLARLYEDVVVAIDPVRQLNNGQPSAHVKWLAAAAPAPGDAVFHLGTGTGYYTAILAELVGPGGRVVGCEIDRELAARARANLAPWRHASVIDGDGSAPGGSYDVIYVSAGATAPRPEWLAALRSGGRLVLPLTVHMPQFPSHGVGLMVRIEHRGVSWPLTTVTQVGFFDCVAARDPALEPALRKMFAVTEPLVIVREPHAPRDGCLVHTAWCCISTGASPA